jgi:glycosyltransferase involved in cell wall biosynthesis
MMAERHVVLVTNTGWSMVHHRRELIAGLIKRAWRVTAIADFGNKDLADLRQQGVNPIGLEVEGSGRNPLKDLAYCRRLARLFRQLRPDIVHSFSIKPVIYGSLAAKRAGARGIVNAVTGGGMLRADDRGDLQRLLRLLYRVALRGRPVTIFQNEDDLELFVGAGLIERARTASIAGSGVDTAALMPDFSIPPAERTCFVMACRMLWSKGVGDFIQAARTIKPRYPHASFALFGGSAEGYGSKNPDFIPRSWLEAVNREGIVMWHGRTEPHAVEQAMRRAAAVVLPSYYGEGVPRVLIEALSAGAPIITTDLPGCRDTVVPGRSGFLCRSRAPEEIADAMAKLLNDPALLIDMGRAGRTLAAEFDSRKIVEQTIEVYEQVLAEAATRKHATPLARIRSASRSLGR